MANTTKRSRTKTKGPKKKQSVLGWRTNDEDEIKRRRLRAASEPLRVKSVEAQPRFFGSYLVTTMNRGAYRVEVRSLGERINTCECPDFQISGLGTCKHIEAVMLQLQKSGKKRFAAAAEQGSPRIEIFLDRHEQPPCVRIAWPRNSNRRSLARKRLEPFFSEEGRLLAAAGAAVPALRREIEGLRRDIRSKIRFSTDLGGWLAGLQTRVAHEQARDTLLKDVSAGKRSLEVVSTALYPYQRDGMLHLAFKGRALLADEMGLGKTVQAIAACELLRRLKDVQRVLVVSPASLKTEWEEQIGKFTELPSLVVQGTRAKRLKQYRESSFFYLTNYEQILADISTINEQLSPDIVILDEAQRIKNWQTKTAETIKRLSSPYAFVLTGTPLENRIDEVYSIVQFLDPHIFGPLFRFNRDFYELDEKGRPSGYKNLDAMHRRLRPIMLRRRKDEVEGELPGRTVNNYFVEMAPEQSNRYEEYLGLVARLAATARRRPLTKEEFEKMQRWLACMRMLCDTPYILDQECRVSPKLDELEKVLTDLFGDGDHKIIIFSEWERMLELVRELSERMGKGYAWHTGSVPQQKRRAEINRFKKDPDCRLFLSTDSGSVGLNLQAADVVINLDLPWNPAKLEQRIARAWRKHQTRPVQVINLVTEGTIEHGMLRRLEQKRNLAEGVVDGKGDLTRMDLPSGRAAFVERIQALVGQPTGVATTRPPISEAPFEAAQQDLVARWSGRLDTLQVYGAETASPTILAVVDHADEALRQQMQSALLDHPGGAEARLEVLDRETYATLRRLSETGALNLSEDVKILHPQTPHPDPARAQQKARLNEARRLFEPATRNNQMAKVLVQGGFAVEALRPAREALEAGLASLAHLEDGDAKELSLDWVDRRSKGNGGLPAHTGRVLDALRRTRQDEDESEAADRCAQVDQILTAIEQTLRG